MVSRSIAACDIAALSHWIHTLGPCSCAVRGVERLFSCRACPVELQYIVCGAYKCPLGADFFYSTQEELAEALRLFDLSEDRLDDGLAPRVDSVPRLGHQFALHPVDRRDGLWDASPGTDWRRLIVLLLARSHV